MYNDKMYQRYHNDNAECSDVMPTLISHPHAMQVFNAKLGTGTGYRYGYYAVVDAYCS